jgi:dTDP-4-dehydrorhamnose 3,5-epimerase
MASVSESKLIAGVFHVVPTVHRDRRGLFVETYRREWIPSGREMIQSNRADRAAGCIVGLHYHLRVGSTTEGTTEVFDLGEPASGENDHSGVLIPPGVAHGFASLTDMTITYLVDGYYNAADELGVAWDDPQIAADWGVTNPELSDRDAANPKRAEIPERARPVWPMRT